MKTIKFTVVYILLAVIFFSFKSVQQQKEENKPELLAPTPPMGWNSFDSYGVYLYEEAAMANLEKFADLLAPHGYEYFVIDAGWFGEFKLKEGTRYPMEKHAANLNFDKNGLLQPSKTYFPNGLKPIIDRCHELGLKFGLHLMRGIPRKAVEQNVPIKGTEYTAAQIADTSSICVWCDQNYGIDMDKPGAQEFYNSLINQMAEWGVDFIKYDDIVPFPKEVDAVAKAIAQCDRSIVLSLSPGGKVDPNALESFKRANMLRVTHDIWDEQLGIDQCFAAWKKWQGKEEPGFWIDMDMIPFGQLLLQNPKPDELTGEESKGEITKRKNKGELTNVELLSGKGWNRWSKFTKDQMYTFITLRALSASPLMMGGDLPTLDDFSLQLITEKEVIACNQNGVMGSLKLEKGGMEVWVTPKQNSTDLWVGIFNRTNGEMEFDTFEVLKEAGVNYQGKEVNDVWAKQALVKGNSVVIGNGVQFLKIN